MAKSNFFVPKPVDIKEYIEIQLENPRFSISRTPFGARPGEIRLVAKHAVPWKFKSVDELPEGVKSGLQKAISVSRACAGVKGTVIYRGVVMPRKAYCQIEKTRGGKLETAATV